MAKLKLLADAWRQPQLDDNGRRVGVRRYRKGDVVEVDSSQVERLLSVNRRNKPYFEEVKATEENKSTSASQPTVQRPSTSTTSDKKS